MDYRIKRSLISHARRLSLSWGPRLAAKAEAKVAPATHECAKCGNWCYEGDSEKNYLKTVAEHPDKTVLFDGIKMDHIDPVVDPLSADESFDTFFARLFCPKINWRPICEKCHSTKTSGENKLRKNIYYKPKKGKK